MCLCFGQIIQISIIFQGWCRPFPIQRQALQVVYNNLALCTSVFQVLNKKPRQVHHDMWNENRTPDQLQVVNILKSHVQVHDHWQKSSHIEAILSIMGSIF